MQSASDTAILAPIPYLPSVSWFVKIVSNPEVQWFFDERYDKRKPRNRCIIATAQGKQVLTVPLQGGRNQRAKLNEILLTESNKWQREHIHALKTAYGKSPFFQFYSDEIFQIISAEHQTLAQLNLTLIQKLIEFFRIHLEEVNAATKSFDEAEHLIVYPQVFSDKIGFIPYCSAIDLLFNLGPDASQILKNYAQQNSP